MGCGISTAHRGRRRSQHECVTEGDPAQSRCVGSTMYGNIQEVIIQNFRSKPNTPMSNIKDAESYLEDSLRLVVHLIMSQPEYQLG